MLFDQFLCILEIRKFLWGLFFSNDAVKPYILHDAWNRLVKSDLCIVSISYLGNSQLLEYSALFHTHTFPSLFRCTLFTHTFYISINFRAVWSKPFCIILLLKCLGCCLFVNILLIENMLLFQKNACFVLCYLESCRCSKVMFSSDVLQNLLTVMLTEISEFLF